MDDESSVLDEMTIGQARGFIALGCCVACIGVPTFYVGEKILKTYRRVRLWFRILIYQP